MVTRRSLIWILIACMLLTSCRNFASASPTPDSALDATPLPETATPVAIDYATLLRNAEYQLGAVDSQQVVQLTDGKYTQGTLGGGDYMSVIVTDFMDMGELDGSDGNEYAMLVSENYGGTGSFMFLAVYDDMDGTPKFLTSRMVDDRPKINELSILDTNEIYLDAVIHGFQDPMCCPTLRTTRLYRLANAGGLLMTNYTSFTPDGRERVITIESPVEYTEVAGSVQLKGSVTIAPFENNLVYRIYDVGGVELAIGPITVTATEMGGPGTFDQTVEFGDLLSGTAIRIEVEDQSMADGSLLAMDSVVLIVQ
jgi:hypothetical protein